MKSIGQQLDGKTLYERQKQTREVNNAVGAPVVIATDLQTSENMGSVLRVADAAGCAHVIFAGAKEIDLNRMHKIARNSEALVRWETTTRENFISRAATYNPLIALEITTESTSLFDTRLPDHCAFVIGGERHGVPAEILALCERAVHIPMFGVNGSMNVTHALAVALFEWRRQRAHPAHRPSPA